MLGLSDRTTEFNKWLVAGKLFKAQQGEDARPPTHILQCGFRGGVICCPPEMEEQLEEYFANAVARKQNPFLIQYLTPTFHLFSDMDIERNRVAPLDEEGRFAYAITCCRTVLSFYSTEPNVTFIICAGDDQPAHGGEFIKYGIRIIMHGLVVDRARARHLNVACQGRLQFEHGTFPETVQNSWQDLCDSKPYGQRIANGNIRMIGSRKCEACPVCKNGNEERDGCEKCEGIGKIDLGRVYRPVLVLNSRLERDPVLLRMLQTNPHQCVAMTSVRRPAGTPMTPHWCPPANAPAAPVDLNESEQKKARANRSRNEKAAQEENDPKKRRQANFRMQVIDDTEFAEDREFLQKKTSLQRMDPNSDSTDLIRETIEGFVRTSAPKVYSQVCVKNVYVKRGPTGAAESYLAYITGQGSSYCFNLRPARSHHSNKVYFEFNANGRMFIKCMCRCDKTADRVFGLCSKYKSSPYTMTARLITILFATAGNRVGSLAVFREESGDPSNALAKNIDGILVNLALELSRFKHGRSAPQESKYKGKGAAESKQGTFAASRGKKRRRDSGMSLRESPAKPPRKKKAAKKPNQDLLNAIVKYGVSTGTSADTLAQATKLMMAAMSRGEAKSGEAKSAASDDDEAASEAEADATEGEAAAVSEDEAEAHHPDVIHDWAGEF